MIKVFNNYTTAESYVLKHGYTAYIIKESIQRINREISQNSSWLRYISSNITPCVEYSDGQLGKIGIDKFGSTVIFTHTLESFNDEISKISK